MENPVLSRRRGIGFVVAIASAVMWMDGTVGGAVETEGLANKATDIPTPTTEPLNASEYWTEDHPYVYQPHYTRLPDGEVVATNTATFDGFKDYRDEVVVQTPWISKWVFSSQGRRTIKKDLPRLLMYNLVSPMDYGNSLRSGNVRRRRNKAVGMFLADKLALPMLKTLGRVAWNLIQSHYVGYFEDQIFAQRLEMMNASEMYEAFNLTPPAEDTEDLKDEVLRPNATLAYVYDGQSKRALLYSRYTAGFSPYNGYSDQYYTRDDLPPPTLPADSYPWLWSPRLDVTRAIALHLMQSFGHDQEINGSSSSREGDDVYASTSHESASSLTPTTTWSDSSVEPGASEADDDSADSAGGEESGESDDLMGEPDVRVLEEIQLQLQEYHFDTGIPRFTLRSDEDHTLFPSFTTFLKKSRAVDLSRNIDNGTNAGMPSAVNSSGSGSFSRMDSAGVFAEPSSPNTSFVANETGSRADFTSRGGVYTALVHFYAYPSVDKWMVSPDKRFPDDGAVASNCSIELHCLVQSGVTVYTPSLANLTLFTTFGDPNVTPASKRALRRNALWDMIAVAFEAELRSLKHGLQAPSTIWYSSHDLDVDEFADAVLGSVVMARKSEADDATPLHVFESLMVEQTPILDQVVSYYADTNHDTKLAMQLNHTVPMLDAFDEGDLVDLIAFFHDRMKDVELEIDVYKQTRAADPQYLEVETATTQGALYNGSQYTLLGFGFVMPATNDKNVLYRDTKLPVPFHLALRLIVRFQESRLLLPVESRQLVSCLAMLLNEISFYRCRPTGSSTSSTASSASKHE
ncbi:hypothetical protein BBJ28_00003341 [Nothophytophthora sp. Chile5]|nr:hypothetical protein BBJ28_00003341 [Nothophytophthora sp. Chile5]